VKTTPAALEVGTKKGHRQKDAKASFFLTKGEKRRGLSAAKKASTKALQLENGTGPEKQKQGLKEQWQNGAPPTRNAGKREKVRGVSKTNLP